MKPPALRDLGLRYRLPTFDQPDRLHLEFQRVLGPFSRFTHFVLLELIFNHQLSSTFFVGKVNKPFLDKWKVMTQLPTLGNLTPPCQYRVMLWPPSPLVIGFMLQGGVPFWGAACNQLCTRHLP